MEKPWDDSRWSQADDLLPTLFALAMNHRRTILLFIKYKKVKISFHSIPPPFSSKCDFQSPVSAHWSWLYIYAICVDRRLLDFAPSELKMLFSAINSALCVHFNHFPNLALLSPRNSSTKTNVIIIAVVVECVVDKCEGLMLSQPSVGRTHRARTEKKLFFSGCCCCLFSSFPLFHSLCARMEYNFSICSTFLSLLNEQKGSRLTLL